MHFISAPLEGSGLCKQHTARQLTRFWNTWSYYRPSCISLQQSFLDLASIHLRDPLKGRPETEVFVDAHTLLLWRMALRDRVWDENEETGVALLPWEGGLRFFWREMSLSGRDIRATTISVDQTRASAAKQLIRGCATKKKKRKSTQCYTTAKDRNLWRSDVSDRWAILKKSKAASPCNTDSTF